MPDFLILSCLSCHRRLKIRNEVQQFVCTQCGTEFVVIRDQDLTYIKFVDDEVLKTQVENEVSQYQHLSQVKEIEQELNSISEEASEDVIRLKINEKINKLENLNVQLIENKKKWDTILLVSFLLIIIIVSVNFALIEAYNELGSTLAVFYIPITLVFSIFFFFYQRKFNSSNNFIKRKIQKLRKDLLA